MYLKLLPKINFFLKIIFIFLLFSLFLTKNALTQVSYGEQKNLINSGSISVGMNCIDLYHDLGGSNKISWLWLGNKKGKHGHYVLLESSAKDSDKIFYLCEQKRLDYESSDSAKDALKDHNLIKIYFEPMKMFTYIFQIASEGSTKYILQRLTLSDYNISRPELITAFALSQKKQLVEEKEPKKKKEKKVVKTAKKEPKKKEKKEKKIALSEDKDPPIIKIADTHTFNNKSYILKGKVKDKSKKVWVEVDGINHEVNKKGEFAIKRYSPVDEEVEVVAIDKWGNTSKKLVKIKIELVTDVAEKLEKLNPTNIKKKQSNNNRVALIIGIEKYETTSPAIFAKNDAKYFYEYARLAFGI